MYSFHNFEPVCGSSLVLTIASWPQISQEAGKVVWYSHLFKNFPQFVVRGTRDQISNIHLIIEKAREFQKNIYFCFIDYAKAFDCVDHNKLWTILKEMECQTTLLASWEICMQVKKQQLTPDIEQQPCSKLGKEYVKAGYCHPAYLTSMQSTSGETLGWKKHKLESRLPGEISITSDMQMTPPLWQKVKRN